MVHFVSEVNVTNIICANMAKDIGTTVKKISFVGMGKSHGQGSLFSDLSVYFVERWPFSSDQEIR